MRSKVDAKAGRILLYILVLCLLITIFLVLRQTYTQQDTAKQTHSAELQEGWSYLWGDSPVDHQGLPSWIWGSTDDSEWKKLTIPGKPLNKDKQRLVWLKLKLPEGEWQEPTLFFIMFQQSFEVYFEGTLSYKYGSMNQDNTTSAPGSPLHFISLSPGYQGKTLYFRIYSPFTDFTGRITEARIGPKSDILLDFVKSHIDIVILACIFIFMGLCLIFIFFFRRKEQFGIFSLGFCSISMGIWLIAESKLIHFVINSPVLIMYIAYSGIFMLPVGFCSFVEQSFEIKAKPLVRKLWQIFLLFAVAAFVLEFFDIVSLFHTVKIFHILLVITMIIVVSTITRAAVKGNHDARIFCVGLIIICLTGIHDILGMFYITTRWFTTIRITQWGMFALILSLVFILGRRYVLLNEKIKAYSREKATNYRLLFENMIDGFIYGKIITDESGVPLDFIILQMNESFERELHLNRSHIIGKEFTKMVPEIRKSSIDWVGIFGEIATAGQKVKFKDNIKIRDKWYDISIFSTKKGYFSAIFSDITESKKAEEIMKTQVYKDPMTGLFNRTYFEEEMLRLNDSLESSKPLSFVSIDIDGLKITNDTFGHKVGDDLIKASAGIVANAFENLGTVARIGGDEFCVILPKTGYETAQSGRDVLNRMVVEYNNSNPFVPISMSIGIATSKHPENEDAYSIYKKADDHMYQYKLTQNVSMKSKVIDMLLAALSERDNVAHGHVERLVAMAEIMASELELSDAERRNLVLLAKVHDLGKIGIPDEILFKPSKLTKEEYEKMKEHSRIGYSIASRSKELFNIANLILHHHEFWNGKGYPEGLKGEEIPLECRILSIIDAFDAMTSKRPYHEGISRSDAIREIEACAGVQFDPVLARKFIEVLQDRESAFTLSDSIPPAYSFNSSQNSPDF